MRHARAAVAATSLRSLAHRAGMPHTSLAHWLNGYDNITCAQAADLATALNQRLELFVPGATSAAGQPHER